MARSIRTLMFSALVLIVLLSSLSLASAQTGNGVIVVATGAAHIRSGPSAGTTSLGTVAWRTEMEVTGRNADMTWWRVNSPFGVGWISDVLVIFRGIFETVPVVAEPVGTLEVPTAIVSTGRLNVRSGPGVEFSDLGSVPWGTKLAITGRHPTLPWYRVQSPFGVGWVRVLYVIVRGTIDNAPFVTEPAGTLDTPLALLAIARTVYSRADTAFPVGTLPIGTYVVLGRTADFRFALLQTPMGNVYIDYNEFALRGIESLLPIVQ